MLTIHHLGHSQSERVVWLCEELGIPYELRHYRRDEVTRLSPPELKALHPLGAAPPGSTPRTQIMHPISIGFISRTAIYNL